MPTPAQRNARHYGARGGTGDTAWLCALDGAMVLRCRDGAASASAVPLTVVTYAGSALRAARLCGRQIVRSLSEHGELRVVDFRNIDLAAAVPTPQPAAEIGSAERLDIADQVIDLCPRQRQIGHRTVGMRQEGAQLVGGSGVCNRGKARRALLKVRGGSASGHVATGAPLLGELAAFGGVCHRALRSRGCKRQRDQHDGGKRVVHGLRLSPRVPASARGARLQRLA
jgi:hypothetical protein